MSTSFLMVKTVLRGHHIYQAVWKLRILGLFLAVHESTNIHDSHALAASKTSVGFHCLGLGSVATASISSFLQCTSPGAKNATYIREHSSKNLVILAKIRDTCNYISLSEGMPKNKMWQNFWRNTVPGKDAGHNCSLFVIAFVTWECKHVWFAGIITSTSIVELNALYTQHWVKYVSREWHLIIYWSSIVHTHCPSGHGARILV